MNFGFGTVNVQKKPEDFFAVICPGTIRANSKFTVVVSIYKSEEPVKIKVYIDGPEFSISEMVEVQPCSYETIIFSIPSIKDGGYKVRAEGLSGIKFSRSKALDYSRENNFVLIQTDKATYKPGDLVRFRILILDKDTCPNKIEHSAAISVMDSQQNIIKQVNNAEFIKGVYSDELQLSQFPNLGKWKIIVNNGMNSDCSNFEVDKYVLPKFEVTIDVPRDVYMKDEMIKAIVRAKYTYGKPVKGEATIIIKEKFPFWQGDSYTQANFLLTKTAPLDGKASFQIDLVNELNSGNILTIKNYEIEASVEETLTGIKIDATADFNIHTKKFKIEGVNIPRNFIEEVPVNVTIVVKNYDGSPVQDALNSVKITIEPARRWERFVFYFKKEDVERATKENKKQEENLKKITFEEKLDKNGMVTVNFIPLKDLTDAYSVGVKYLDQDQFLGSINNQKMSGAFELDIQTEKARVDKEVIMHVTSKLPLKYFFYQIIARGNIVDAGKIDIPEDRTYYEFKFQPTFAMVPSCYVFAYYIKDGEVVFAEKMLEIEEKLNNFIKINAPTQVKAGEEVELKVTTKPDSYVGLLGVDQSVLLLKSGNDLSINEVINGLSKFKSRLLLGPENYGRKIPGMTSGVIMMTNADFEKEQLQQQDFFGGCSGANMPLFGGAANRCASVGMAFGSSSPSLAGQTLFGSQPKLKKAAPPLVIRKRKDFPETWLWSSTTENHNGEVIIRNKVPDTITSWVLTGFSVNPKCGLGLTSQPHKLRVFQPFFISTNLPYSVKRGEIISLPVVVFNYMDDNIKADLTLDNPHNEFEFVLPPGETKSTIDDGNKQTKAIEIESGTGVSKSFLIRPTKAGQISLKISAASVIAGDIIHQILRVDPEGVTEFQNKAVLLKLENLKEHTEEISIEVPKDAVPDSTYIELSVVRDLLGPTIKNLDKLIRKPCGCGEQNMVFFVPNILIIKYLTNIKKVTLEIANRAQRFLEIGYQRELTYKHSDGSYSAFGNCDKNGSTWLTAYVAREFYEAKQFTNIDNKAIKDALDFLVFRQTEYGDFAETGRIVDQCHAGKSTKGLALTAFTLLAFLENKEETATYQHVIYKGLEYLVKNIDDKIDTYALAISAYVLQKAKHEKKEIFLEKLNARKTIADKLSWWTEGGIPNIEITGYALLAQLESGAGEATRPVLKWLVGQRNSNGGFKSTQDTVVGLSAIVRFCEAYNKSGSSANFTFSDDKGGNGTIVVNNENAIVLQTHVLNPAARVVKITGRGNGSSLIQVSYRYNVDNKDDTPRFKITPEVKNTLNVEQMQLSVCTSFIPQEDEKISNMAVMEVSLPSGYIADADNLKEIEKTERVKKVETKNGESIIVIYFDDLDSTDVCPLIKGFRAHRVAEQKPSAILVYDYYNNNRQARVFYEINNISLNDICDGS